jgi:Asp-tRNA(Asn)/Glu-tRNA(Gln) amidotransferase C subunit
VKGFEQMKREDLKMLELTDEAIDEIMKLHGKSIEAHKTQLTEAEKQVEALQGQLEEANKAIEGFKELDVDGIKAAADEWKAKAEQAKVEAEAEIIRLKFDHALEGALTEAKAKNPKAVKALLNFDNLKLAEDGKIVDLEDQLKAIKDENDYLFESEQPTPKIVAGGQGKTKITDSMVIAARQAAGLPIEE